MRLPRFRNGFEGEEHAVRSDVIIRAEERERCIQVIMKLRYGTPSSWTDGAPPRWRFDRPCSPTEAAEHDNGIIEAYNAIRALT